jgi:hypothetical protein
MVFCGSSAKPRESSAEVTSNAMAVAAAKAEIEHGFWPSVIRRALVPFERQEIVPPHSLTFMVGMAETELCPAITSPGSTPKPGDGLLQVTEFDWAIAQHLTQEVLRVNMPLFGGYTVPGRSRDGVTRVLEVVGCPEPEANIRVRFGCREQERRSCALR